MIANLEFEDHYGYDPDVDYDQIVDRFNQYVAEGLIDNLNNLLHEHGGLLSIVAKRQYQHDLQTKNTRIK